MDKISDVTRQDIIDIIRNGFEVFLDELQYDSISSDYVTHYTAKIPYYGRLDELGFLERLYDLDNMPSNDDELSDGEKAEYRAEINAEFTKSNLPFQLNDYGLIAHTVEAEVLSPEIIGLLPKIQEPGLRELLETAIIRHQQPDFQSHRDAVEKIWDVLERLKTYYTDLDKKASANKIINDMAGGQSEYQDLFEEEFRVLTNIGNRFCIRHHETNKIDITDIRHCDYFFNRCLSLIALALQYLDS